MSWGKIAQEICGVSNPTTRSYVKQANKRMTGASKRRSKARKAKRGRPKAKAAQIEALNVSGPSRGVEAPPGREITRTPEGRALEVDDEMLAGAIEALGVALGISLEDVSLLRDLVSHEGPDGERRLTSPVDDKLINAQIKAVRELAITAKTILEEVRAHQRHDTQITVDQRSVTIHTADAGAIVERVARFLTPEQLGELAEELGIEGFEPTEEVKPRSPRGKSTK